jgi:hypothetical protein
MPAVPSVVSRNQFALSASDNIPSPSGRGLEPAPANPSTGSGQALGVRGSN